MDNITRNLLIMVVNKEMYYGNKLNYPLLNPNQLRCYEMMLWYNPFDPNIYIYLQTYEGNKIDLIPDGTKIGFSLHLTTKEELRTLPHIEVTPGT